MEQKPSIGRTVHYQKYGTPGGEHKAEPSPAVITQIHEVNDEREDAFLAGMAAQHEASRLIGMIEQARESAQGMEGVWLTDTLDDVEAYEAQLAEILAKGEV